MFPKKVHLTCKNKTNFDNNPIWKKCYEQYKKIYVEYEIKIYDNNDIYCLIQKYFPQHLNIIKDIDIGAILADIFRYLILYLEGGIYSDMDCEPLKPIQCLYNEIHYHGDKNRNNNFYIYNKTEELLNIEWDFYENPCDNSILESNTLHICEFKMRNDLKDTYKCLGHKEITYNTQLIIGKEYFQHPEIFNNKYNNFRLCQWFIIAKPNNQILLECYLESIKNIKERWNIIKSLKNKPNEYFLEVVSCTGPIMFTKIINKTLPNKAVAILENDYFCSGSAGLVPITRNSYVKHHFTSSWTIN
jgi:hypothetical protein